MSIKVAINGFGRIGRLSLRAARGSEIEVVAVNDLTDAATLAHLLKYDSTYGRYPDQVSVSGNNITVGSQKIQVFAEKEPERLPWEDLGIDVVIESTGKFTKKPQAEAHRAAGAKKVLISAPAKEHDGTFVPGVNWDKYDKKAHNVISIGSCTTNCLAPIVKVVLENFGIKRGFMTTIHAYTNDQRLQDSPHKDLRRARAAAMSLIPTTTGAARAISEVFPETKGKLDGCAIRVPTPVGSLVDLAVEMEKDATADDIRTAMKKAADGPLKGVLYYMADPIVSVDIIGDTHSSIFDAEMTMSHGSLAKIFSWYDNEYGFCNRMIDMIKRMI